MRPLTCMKIAVLSAAMLAAPLDFGFGSVGVTSAEAKGFYTRKRINGRWITGRFAKRSSGRVRTAAIQSKAAALSRASAPAALAAALPERNAAAAASASAIDARSETASRDDHLVKLRQALEARASVIVTTGAEPARPAQDDPFATSSITSPPPLVAREPRSVSLDFQSGVKTTFFVDGGSVVEAFDPASLKALASPGGTVPADGQGQSPAR